MTATQTEHAVVSNEVWLQERKTLLKQEKEFTRQRDELSRKRRELPWVKVENGYAFDAPEGRVALSDLFGGRSQLMVYHFMFGPDWEAGCPSCSMLADSIEGALVHVQQRDTAFVMVSRAPIGKIEAFKQRMGWSHPWVSSYGSDFNRDYHVSFTKEEIEKGEMYYNFEAAKFPADEAPGMSVFYKDADGSIFHTYSTYARGLDPLLGAYHLLDLTPKGRDEDNFGSNAMSWVRHHDSYADSAKSCCGS